MGTSSSLTQQSHQSNQQQAIKATSAQVKLFDMAPRPSMVPTVMPMLGKVTLEEAFQPPWKMEEATGSNIGLYVYPEREDDYVSGICNIKDRVMEARAAGVGYSVCSLTVPGVQGETDPKAAEEFATRSNNWTAEQIKAYPTDLGAFGAVSMHNPKQAAIEATRCIKEFGFHGIMVNNWQQAVKTNGEPTYLLYDGRPRVLHFLVCS